MKPVYVISGWMRTGTSMMMRALEAGGMDAVYRQSRDVMKNRHADEVYDPNIGGLYELERRDYREPGFPAGYEGKLIKCLRRGPSRMAVVGGGIKVVYMMRNSEEIRQSFGAFFPRAVPQSAESIEEETRKNIEAMEVRTDIGLMTMPYTGVLHDPRLHLDIVADHFEVDLNIDAAAAVIDPSLRRFRADELTPGIV